LSNSYTPNIQLAMPAIGDTGWAVPVNGNCTILDSVAAVGALAITTTEVPSASLNIHVAAGMYEKQDGSVVTFAGVVSEPVTASTSSYVYLDLTNSGNLAIATSGWPTTAHVRLALVVAGSATIASVIDQRVAYGVVGSILDGTHFSFGTATGAQLGTAANQKLAFYGQMPTTQPTMGAATAGATYGTNEQNMLEAVYNAMRTLGLGS
jgi:phage-related tail protein